MNEVSPSDQRRHTSLWYERQIVNVYVEKKVMVLVYLHVGNCGGISLYCTALLKIG